MWETKEKTQKTSICAYCDMNIRQSYGDHYVRKTVGISRLPTTDKYW